MAISNSKYQQDCNMIYSEPPKESIDLPNIIDTIISNNLGLYYQRENSSFFRGIDKLNFYFYLETEKYFKNKHTELKTQENLIVILIQQIGLYITEVERLNSLLQEKSRNKETIKEEEKNSFIKEKYSDSKDNLINPLKFCKNCFLNKYVETSNIETKINAEDDYIQRSIGDDHVLGQQENNDKVNSIDKKQPIDQYIINRSLNTSKRLTQRRNFSEHDQTKLKDQKNCEQNDLYIPRAQNQLNGSSNSSINSLYGLKILEKKINKSNSVVKKNRFKIIKSIKHHQLSKSKLKHIDSTNSSTYRSPMKVNEQHKGDIVQYQKELNTLNIVEQFLLEMKSDVLQENNKDPNIYCQTSDLLLNTYNETIKDQIIQSHIRSKKKPNTYTHKRVIEEDKSMDNNPCNFSILSPEKENKQSSVLNSITIDLKCPLSTDIDRNNKLIAHDSKYKSILTNLRHYNSAVKRKQGL